MKAVIINFRGGLNTRHEKYAILRPTVNYKGSLIGRKVVWEDPRSDRRVIGKIVKAHGSRNYVARFRSGLPGWATGNRVEIL
jgi:ribosomal protein L35AE/L33A